MKSSMIVERTVVAVDWQGVCNTLFMVGVQGIGPGLLQGTEVAEPMQQEFPRHQEKYGSEPVREHRLFS